VGVPGVGHHVMRRGVRSTAAFYSHAERGRCLGNEYYVPGISGIPGAADVGTQDVVLCVANHGRKGGQQSFRVTVSRQPRA